ncbi:MAG: hypothetical protein KF847_20690 [Pirellulales bacterium]|nr:hypothetical protein [Pirellulales bacterium]
MADLRSQDGYPPRYHDTVRRSWRFSLWLASLTLLVAGLAVVATLYLNLPAVFAAAALAVCLLFGLFGNVMSLIDVRSVRLTPYFQRTVGEIETFLSGKALARNLRFLDDRAVQQGVEPLSSFGFADDLLGETPVWRQPAEGLRTCRALLEGLRQGAGPVGDDGATLRWTVTLRCASYIGAGEDILETMSRTGKSIGFVSHHLPRFTAGLTGLTLILLLLPGASWGWPVEDLAEAIRQIDGKYRREAIERDAPPEFHWINFQGSKVDDDWLLNRSEQLIDLPNLSVTLSQTRVSGRGLSAFREAPNVIDLELSGVPLTDSDLAQLARLPKLQILYVDRTGVSGSDLSLLAKTPTLNSLCIDSSQATPAGVAELAKFPQLKSIIVVDATDACVANLATLRAPPMLSLRSGDVTAVSLSHLQKMNHLQHLLLFDTGFSESELELLRKALPECHVTQSSYSVIEQSKAAFWDGVVPGRPSSP